MRIYYYKCRTKGCAFNKNASQMHQLFAEFIEQWAVAPEITKAVVISLQNRLQAAEAPGDQTEKALQLRLFEVERKLDKLEEKYFITEEMSEATYTKFRTRYAEEKTEILKDLAVCGKKISNQVTALEKAVKLCDNLLNIWKLGNIRVKERLQKLLFPTGVDYDRENGVFRTEKTNGLICLIADLARLSGGVKKGTPPFLLEESLSGWKQRGIIFADSSLFPS